MDLLRRIGWIIVLIVLLSVSFAQADVPSPQHHRSVVNLLTSKRGFPTKKQMLRTGKGTTTVRILSAIINDRDKRPRLRLNAMRALEYFPTRDAEKFLSSVLYGRFWQTAYKTTAMRVLARSFGGNMYFELLPFMRDPNPRLRSGAALALGELDDPRVVGNLNNHLAHEKELSVRTAIEKAMKAFRTRRAQARQRKNEARKGF